jgi:hypothetical protein
MTCLMVGVAALGGWSDFDVLFAPLSLDDRKQIQLSGKIGAAQLPAPRGCGTGAGRDRTKM